MPERVGDDAVLLDEAEEDALLSFSAPFSSSFLSHFSCGLLETRFALTCASFFIVLLFWAHQGVLAMIVLAFVGACVMMALLRLVLLARYKPTELYELDDAEQRAIREQQQLIKSANSLSHPTPHHTLHPTRQPPYPAHRRTIALHTRSLCCVQCLAHGCECCGRREPDPPPSGNDGPRLHSQRLRAAAGSRRGDAGTAAPWHTAAAHRATAHFPYTGQLEEGE